MKKTYFISALGITMLALMGFSYADDTEVFYTESEINNNVLFIMDNSGSMKEEVDGTSAVGEKTTVSSAIIDKNEDADEHNFPSLRGTAHSGNILEMTKDGLFTQKVGLRFRDLDIPKGAKIDSAFIQFTASNSSSASTTLDIKIQNHDNPSAFENNLTNISNRTLYGTSVSWSVDPWVVGESGAAQQTPDLKSLVQLVVDRGDWDPNDAMVFVISGYGERNPKSRDNGDGSGAPVLTITYEEVTGKKTRMQVMQDALRTVLTNAPDNLSVGIMNYGDNSNWRKNYPNGIKFPITAVTSLARPIIEDSMMLNGTVRWDYSNIPEPSDTVTVRTFLSEIADDWEAKGMTPIVDALYEASQYFRGEEVDYGYDYARKNYTWAAHPSTYAGEPVNQKNDSGSCDASPSGYRVWNDSIADWRAGETWGKICPADRFNPSGPGLASNCAGTEYNCKTESYWGCRSSWVGGTTTCTGTDEDGNPTGCSTTGKYCKDNDYGTITNSSCYYAICKDSPLPKPKYESPMKDGCQSSFMILMSDGKPEYSNGVNRDPYSYGRVKSLINKSSCDITHGFRSGRCGADLTQYLATHDNQPNVNGDQFLHTYVIGFSEGITPEASEYLQSLVTLEDDPETAKKEGYFSATNEAELADAFSQALDEIAEEARSQASPGYSVNVKSGLEHEDDIYIPVFDKSSSSRWAGNLKKFKLDDVGDSRIIKGKDGNGGLTSAMTELGLFKDEAWDLWSTSAIPDGDVVQQGGTASLLTNPAIRKLYSNVSGNTLSEINVANTGITEEMLFDKDGLNLNTVEAAAYRAQLIQFIRGWKNGQFDSNATPHGVARKHMGDMLHTEPVIITYKKSTDDAAKKQYIFSATNEGYLHVFDSTSGEEIFAFMPQELLKNIEPQFTGQGPHKYGIDGNISYWHEDDPDNPNGEVDSGEKVYLYFGLRRGGKSYYALDVSNIHKGQTPTMLWKIDGDDSQFSRMGQSWSMPYLANVLVGSGSSAVKKEAVIIAGGNDPVLDYDEDYEPADVVISKTPTMGDDIYIVDAKTGDKLWSMRETLGAKVTQAFPGGARILDVNKNNILDRMYFADTGGSVWRLDFLTESLSNNAEDFKLTKLADLGTAGSSAARKFYNEPDVASFRSNGKTMFTVSVGSGMRPHPMNEEINDHMFVILDKSPLNKLDDDFTPIQLSDLAKVEIDVVGTGTTLTKSITQDSDFEGKQITETDKLGWYVNFFESGEKVLAPAITFEGSITFTTLVPKVLTTGELINSCAAPATQGRIYAMNLLTGEASIDMDGNGVINDNDVFQTISASEIPGTPQRVFNELSCENGECSHEVDIRIGKKSTEVGTMDVEAIESIYWSDPM
ncbi:PilC/PilY family type IV pilus protein [Cocleimonas sp. KMM 6895]|uniref:pilus assembly protein n=2 Tax=Cocleimonas TaxID=998014 RepID=UPI002DBA4A74|nr:MULTISPECIES: PilC/PilY family type IV pilus protein [unclassified Cocleimonas]MEC4716429.1 PilC/PilY family type IV pilus protein [Cocleimonas sp. KMM 6895]MEC4745678.1 PilC/PilY family type IV pilus protein [Cocleimonas sp. KMM 6896]